MIFFPLRVYCYLVVVERLVSLNELEGICWREIYFSWEGHPSQKSGVNLDQKQSPRSPCYEAGLEIHYYENRDDNYRCFAWYGHSDLWNPR